MEKILWVDDQIDQMGEYVKIVEGFGFEVSAKSSAREALEEAEKTDFDHLLLDLRMPDMDGVQFLREVVRQGFQGNTAVFSSYLYLNEFREKLGALDYPAILMDKDFPNIDAEDFSERFEIPLKSFLSNPKRESLQGQLNKKVIIKDDPFAISYKEFVNLSVLEKEKLTAKAQSMAKATIGKAFDDGLLWVFMCGDHETIRASAKSVDKIQSNDSLLDFAREQDRAPYQFFRPIGLDDIDAWQSCGEDSHLAYYPSANVSLNRRKFLVHFDTGAPFTFFSYEELIEAGVLRANELLFTPCKRGNSSYQAATLDVEVFLRCQDSDQTKKVRLRGQVVRDWLNSPFKRHCLEQRCKQIGEVISDGQNCLLRIGLIGRNLLTENQLTLVLDGSKRKTRFLVDQEN